MNTNEQIWKMEHLLQSKCTIFHNIFKYMIFQRLQKVLLWRKGLNVFVAETQLAETLIRVHTVSVKISFWQTISAENIFRSFFFLGGGGGGGLADETLDWDWLGPTECWSDLDPGCLTFL